MKKARTNTNTKIPVHVEAYANCHQPVIERTWQSPVEKLCGSQAYPEVQGVGSGISQVIRPVIMTVVADVFQRKVYYQSKATTMLRKIIALPPRPFRTKNSTQLSSKQSLSEI